MIIVWTIMNMESGEIKEYRWINKDIDGNKFYQSDEEVEKEIQEYINNSILYNTLDDGDDDFWMQTFDNYMFDWKREW